MSSSDTSKSYSLSDSAHFVGNQEAYVSVPRVLLSTEPFNAYSTESAARKQSFHTSGRAFLKKLAKALGLAEGTYEVRSNVAGPAVSGEVTLHSDDIYVQLSESCLARGISVLHRSCASRKDYCGHQNYSAMMQDFSGSENQAKMVKRLRTLIERERQRKAASQA